ncbi:MAG: SH3 domain-containing protein [Spirochaetota bacterium]
MKALRLLVLILLLNTCSSSQKTSSVETSYTNTDSFRSYFPKYSAGVNIYTSADTTSKVLTHVPFIGRSKTPLFHQNTKQQGWLQVRYKKQTGWVQEIKITKYYFLNNRYFRVASKSGLYLREKPSIKSKILGIARRNHIGSILDIEEEKNHIQKTQGNWLQTKLKNRIGWMFSGFVEIGEKQELKEQIAKQWEKKHEPQYLDELKPSEDKTIKFLAPIKNLKLTTIKNYIIYEVRYKALDWCDAWYLEETIVWNTSTKKLYYLTRKKLIVKLTGIHKELGILYTNVEDCSCCCGGGAIHHDAFFLQEDRILVHKDLPKETHETQEFSDTNPYVSYFYIERGLYVTEILFGRSSKNKLVIKEKRVYTLQKENGTQVFSHTFEGQHIPKNLKYLLTATVTNLKNYIAKSNSSYLYPPQTP